MASTTDTPTPQQIADATFAAPVAKTKRVKRTWTPFSADVAKAIAANARPATSPCLCGCGEQTKSRFAPGHDATLKAQLDVTIAQGSTAAVKHATAAKTAFGWD